MKSPHEYFSTKLINSHIISSMCTLIYRPIGKRQDGGEQQGVELVT
jgi:hypothetical protein